MTILAILWFVLIIVSTPIGLNILKLTRAAEFERPGDRFMISVWLGLSIISVLLLTASLSFALSPKLLVVIATPIFLLSLCRSAIRYEIGTWLRQMEWPAFVGVLGLVIGVAAYSVQPIRYYDTGLYHFGAVRWLSRFGAVTGLGLIHIRFGAASSWFALFAPFNAGRLEGRIGMLLSGLSLLLASCHLVLCLNRCLLRRAKEADWFIVSATLFLIPCAIYWRMFTSMAPDVAVIMATIAVSWAILIISRSPRSPETYVAVDPSIIPFILASWAVSVKLSALGLIVVTAVFCVYRNRRHLRSLVWPVLAGALFLIPLISYQVVTAGCPLLPTGIMCLHTPWSVGAPAAKELTALITDWSKWGGAPPPDAGRFDWLWRAWLTQGTTYKSVLVVFASTIIAIAGYAIKQRYGTRPGVWLIRLGIAGAAALLMFRATNLLLLYLIVVSLFTVRSQFTGKYWVLGIGLCGAAIALCSAPNFRYNFGYITILVAVILVSRRDTLERFCYLIAKTIPASKRIPPLLALSIILAILVGFSRVLLPNQPSPRMIFASTEEEGPSLFWPPHLPTAVVVKQRVNDIDYYVPAQGDQCWASAIPCAPNTISSDISLRDPPRDLSGGFQHENAFANRSSR